MNMMKPMCKTLVQMLDRKHQIVVALLGNLEYWMPKANSAKDAIDILGLDPDEYFQDEKFATSDVIEIQQRWIAHQVNEQATAIMRELYGHSDITLMDQVNANEINS